MEIDSTWYRSPSHRTVEAWAEKVTGGFVFSAKVPKTITHDRYLEGCDAERVQFLKAMDRLGEKKGPLLFQFPYVAKGKDADEYRTGDDFRRRLAAFLPELPADGRYVYFNNHFAGFGPGSAEVFLRVWAEEGELNPP